MESVISMVLLPQLGIHHLISLLTTPPSLPPPLLPQEFPLMKALQRGEDAHFDQVRLSRSQVPILLPKSRSLVGRFHPTSPGPMSDTSHYHSIVWLGRGSLRLGTSLAGMECWLPSYGIQAEVCGCLCLTTTSRCHSSYVV